MRFVSHLSANGAVGPVNGAGATARRPYHRRMTRPILLLMLWWWLPTVGWAQARPDGLVDVCPVRAAESVPPAQFDRPDCERLPLYRVDPQGRHLWLRMQLQPDAPESTDYLGLLIAAKASSELYIGGELIGRNGLPGADARSEIAGRMDVVLPLDRARLRAADHAIVLRMSSQQGWLQLVGPIHAIELVGSPDVQNQTLRYYLPSLLPLGVFLLFNLGPNNRLLPKIFLGDGGSVTLGFLVTASLVYFSQGENALIEPVTALWLVTLPLMDMLATMLRRLKHGHKLMQADRSHLHHTLMDMGFSSRQTLVLLVSHATACALLGLVLELVPAYLSLLAYCLLFLGHCLFVIRAERIGDRLSRYLGLVPARKGEYCEPN